MIKLTKSGIESLKPRAKRYAETVHNYPGLMVRVATTGSVSFRYDYRLRNGKREAITLPGRYGYPWTAQLVATEVNRLRGIIAAGESPRGEMVDEFDDAKAHQVEHSTDTIVRDFIEGEYKDWIEIHRKGADKTLIRLRGAAFDLFLCKCLSEVTGFDIDTWRTQRRRDGVAIKTVNRDHAALASVFKHALELGRIEDTPFRTVKMYREKQGVGVVRYLSQEEETRLRSALLDNHESTPYLRPLVLTALNTGLRRGELLALTWPMIDFRTRNLTVHYTTAKDSETRHVPMNAELVEALKEWRKVGQSNVTDLIFHNRGSRIADVKTAWRSLMRRAEIQNFRFHDLRHTFASKLVMAGVPLLTVGQFLGHATPAMTQRYAHLSDDHRRDAIEKLAFTG